MERMTKEQREPAAAFVRQCAPSLDNDFNKIADELDVIRECASSIALTLLGDGSCFDSERIDGNLGRAQKAIFQLIRAAEALDAFTFITKTEFTEKGSND